MRKKYNVYDMSQTYGIGYTSNTNKVFYFDKDKYELIKDYCWLENDQGYIIARNPKTNRHIRMHRLLLLPSKNQIIDHINNNKADNRCVNLRYANKSTNGINRGCNVTNKLKIKGVSKCSNCNKYMARIMVNKKEKYLGLFSTIEEAQLARKKAEKEYFGGFAYDGE